MTVKPSLHIVPFDPNDYSAGDLLNRESKEEVNSSEKISSALSLVFQHPKNVESFLLLTGDKHPLPVEISYDMEERSISELYLKGIPENSSAMKMKEGEKAFVRFEVFRQCYEFEATVLVEPMDGLIVVSPPVCLMAVKDRRLPRVVVTESDQSKLAPLWVKNQSGERFSVKCLEVGLTSIKIELDKSKVDKIKYIYISEAEIPIGAARVLGQHEVAFRLSPRDCQEYGAIFDFYRIVAYPHLRRREEFPISEVLELYAGQTGYFDKFSAQSDRSDRKELIHDTWKDLIKEQHRVTADYVTVDESGTLAGASSAVLAFQSAKRPVWAFHQLCARTSPDLLIQSGELYTWRAEYLAGRSEDLDVIGWFDSKSRWLERIYVKFAMQNAADVELIPVVVVRRLFSKQEDLQTDGSAFKDKYGEHVRYFYNSESVVAGVSPQYLNAAGGLNSVIATGPSSTEEMVKAAVSDLLRKTNVTEELLELTVAYERQSQFDIGDCEVIEEASRFCILKKPSLSAFIGSVEHSVAITARKKAEGATNA